MPKLDKNNCQKAASQSAKKVLWQRLTEEFNAIEGNSMRTETQLKECWHNLKTLQKGGQYKLNEPEPGTSRETLVAEALYEQTDVEIEGVIDSDTVYSSEDAVVVEPVGTADMEIPPHHETPPPAPRRETPPHPDTPPLRPVPQLTDFGSAPLRGTRNVRSRVIEEEFAVRQQAYQKKEKREEELFELQKKERVFMLMAAEQSYLTAKVKHEAAEELLRCNRAKRELAEYDLKIKKQ